MAKILSRTRCVAVVDIGSGFVGCAIVEISRSSASRVISYGHSRLSLENRDDSRARTQLPGEVAEAIQAALSRAAQSLHVARMISDVHVIMHAPWMSSLTVSKSQVFEASSAIRASHIAALAQQSLSSAKIDTKKLYEKSVITTRLNGYKTFAPEGKRAQTIDVSAILSLGDPDLIRTVSNEIEKVLPSRKLAWISAQHAYATVLTRSGFPEDVLLVDVGVSATQIAVFREGIPLMDRVVSEGLQGILARVQNIDAAQETLGIFRLYARDACESTTCVELRQAIASAEPHLVKVFGEHVAELASTRRVPNAVVVVAHPDVTKWLSAFFERIDFSQFTATSLPFISRELASTELGRWIQCDDAMDTALVLAAAYTAIREQST